MVHTIPYKIGRALLDLPHSMRKTPSPRIIMTLLVKNEEDMLAQNLEFHHAMGVNHFGSPDKYEEHINWCAWFLPSKYLISTP